MSPMALQAMRRIGKGWGAGLSVSLNPALFGDKQ